MWFFYDGGGPGGCCTDKARRASEPKTRPAGGGGGGEERPKRGIPPEAEGARPAQPKGLFYLVFLSKGGGRAGRLQRLLTGG